MSANTVTSSRGHRDEAYRCSRSKRRAGCTAPRIGRKTLEDAVLHTLKDYILLPGNLAAMMEIEQKNSHRNEEQIRQRLNDLQAEKKKQSSQIANLTRAIAERGHSQALLDKLTELEATRAQISVEISRLSEHASEPYVPLQPGEIEGLAAVFITALESLPSEQVRQLLQKFITRVSVRRTENGVVGLITYLMPRKHTPPFDFPPSDGKGTLPKGWASVGALHHYVLKEWESALMPLPFFHGKGGESRIG
jgi:hypothetical protein